VHLPGGGALLAGSFVRVRLKVQRTTPPVMVPTSALAMRKEGPRVVVLLADRRVQQRTVVPGRDMGAEIELLEGLQGGERVVLSPGDDLQDGAVVTVAEGAGGK
jgi:hypothetical protein